jgi:spore maturation protein CgeB
MRFVLFYHSLVSDWNHGNAHFLRGLVTELKASGHAVEVYEPQDGWSVQNLKSEHGEEAIAEFHRAYPGLQSITYDLAALDLEAVTRDADVVLVHEWNSLPLVKHLGDLRAQGAPFRLFFHDTHHRLVTDPGTMHGYDLRAYDGVLAYGKVLRDLYAASGRVKAAWTWHEAADTRLFQPLPGSAAAGDLVWIGNWGDEERSAGLHEFLIEPVRALGLKARVYGVRYPDEARRALAEAGIEYGGWLPNFRVPEVFSRFKVTVHVPRRPYMEALPGIPTIRVFEALACGIPMVSAPWNDAEGLFTPGRDYVIARSGKEMRRSLLMLLEDPSRAAALAAHGVSTIQARHTCRHRVNQLLEIVNDARPGRTPDRNL